jgi:hypothetical protein
MDIVPINISSPREPQDIDIEPSFLVVGYTRRRKTKQKHNKTQYVLDTTLCKQTQIT